MVTFTGTPPVGESRLQRTSRNADPERQNDARQVAYRLLHAFPSSNGRILRMARFRAAMTLG